MKKKKTQIRNFFTLAFIMSFAFQQFYIFDVGVAIKPYMIFVLLSLFYFIFAKNIKIHIPSGVYVLAILFIFLTISSMWSNNINLALVRSLGAVMLILTLFSVFICEINSTLRYQSLLKVFFIFSVASIIYYLIGFGYVNYSEVNLVGFDRGVLGLYVEGNSPRFRGFTDSPNNSIIISLIILIYSLTIKGKLSVTCRFLSFTMILLSFSMTGIISSIFIFLCYSIASNRWNILKVLLIFLLLLMVLFLFYTESAEFSRLVDLRVDRLSSGSGRIDLFKFILHLISERPLFGYGIGQARDLLRGFGGRDLQSSHNSFLEVFLESGIIAFILLISFTILLFFELINSKVPLIVKSVLLGGWCSFVIMNSANNMIYVELMMLFVFALYFIKFSSEVMYKNDNAKIKQA